jgi:hypothetical protein
LKTGSLGALGIALFQVGKSGNGNGNGNETVLVLRRKQTSGSGVLDQVHIIDKDIQMKIISHAYHINFLRRSKVVQ